MSDLVPFVYSKIDANLLQEFYADSTICRCSLESLLAADAVPSAERWIDGGVDGLHHEPKYLTDSWKSCLGSLPEFAHVADVAFGGKPSKQRIADFAHEVLGQCAKHKAKWITVPQLPIVDDGNRSGINRALAQAAGLWSDMPRGCKKILPVIITHQSQTNAKVARNKNVASAVRCFEHSGADGVWIVDSSLSDQLGSNTFRKRFDGIASFHEELLTKLGGEPIVVAGPYWGLGLVLWARGLASHPAAGLGSAYQYHISGMVPHRGKRRLAIPPIRRWAVMSPDLRDWAHQSQETLDNLDRAHREFMDLEKNREVKNLISGWERLLETQQTRRQIAAFYKQWVDKIETVSPMGRAIALYQDLSSAYVLGKSLNPLPPTEKPGRRPERVAQQLMLTCLSE